MKKKLRDAYNHEMQLAKSMFKKQDYAQCYYHLERGHILGQRNYIPHVLNHFWMFKVGVKQRDLREVLGQVTRMIMSIFSLISLVPKGNTGRARISPIKTMPIPSDLEDYFK